MGEVDNGCDDGGLPKTTLECQGKATELLLVMTTSIIITTTMPPHHGQSSAEDRPPKGRAVKDMIIVVYVEDLQQHPGPAHRRTHARKFSSLPLANFQVAHMHAAPTMTWVCAPCTLVPFTIVAYLGTVCIAFIQPLYLSGIQLLPHEAMFVVAVHMCLCNEAKPTDRAPWAALNQALSKVAGVQI